MNEFPKKIAIIGVGLIGGSIALGLKQHFGTKMKIFGSCSDTRRSQKAKNDGVIDEIFDIEIPHPEIKFFIIATPILQIPEILTKLSKIKTKSAVLDVGSTKEFIMKSAVGILPKYISFIGTHPMAGSELNGFENADPHLFRNKPWIVCNGQQVANELIEILGAKMILMEAKTHDQLAAWASHLNLVSASILINTIRKQKNWPAVAKIASTGFRDATRLASHNAEMKKDIILTNKESITGTLIKFRQEIDLFIKLLKSSGTIEVTNYLSEAKNIRDNWLANYFS